MINNYESPVDTPIIEIDALSGGGIPGFPGLSSKLAARNVNEFAGKLKEAGLEPTVSVFAGNVFDLASIASDLRYPITSGDTSFVLDVKTMKAEFVRNLGQAGPVSALAALLFSTTCVRNQKEFEQKTDQVLGIVTPVRDVNSGDSGMKWIRAASSFFASGRMAQGDKLVSMLKENPDMALTLEQDAKFHNWIQYVETFINLESQFPGRVFISFDPAHLVESKRLNPNIYQPTVIEAFNSHVEHIAGIEVNMHTPGVGNSDVHYDNLFKAYGTEGKKGRLNAPKRLIYEPTPVVGFRGVSPVLMLKDFSDIVEDSFNRN